MANREYYGNNVPLNLVGEQESRQFAHPRTQIQSSDSQSSFGQFPNQNEHNLPSAPNTTQNLPYEQDQTQWRDPTNPEYGPNGEEGGKGLGSTLVGGAGGAFVGHEVGKKSDHGVLGTIGGAIAGAFAANLATTRLQSKATTPIANGPLSSLQARENVAYPSDPEEGYRASPTLITGNSSFTTQQKPIAPRGRKSQWATLSIEAEASLSLIYRELESATSLEKQLEQLREENSRYLQMIKIRDQDLIALRREMGNQRISDGELESLKARADQYDTVLQELERTSS
ncbi:hypothetical protein BDV34DRAFT_230753 [Aspergillus parasiticus]|uniref:Glycine zipper 2TM domain-containing protein n=1 Tax=Aspergillus parasiticus TaxID=5067 RepID=A0A5N6D4U8_ASPPA|nr:hypothetical protein BDV34DRAFT_230753 [Aspergillus parasiticus]